MISGSVQAKRKIFIREMIAGGTESVAAMIIAYKKAYPTCKKDSTARVSAYNLLQNPDIVRQIDNGKREKEELIKRVQREEIERLAREQIVSQTQIEAVLSSIAMGKFRRKKVIAAVDVKSKKVITGEIEEAPTETDMIAASDKLLKIKGAYSKDNVVRHEVGDTFMELMKARAKRKKENVQSGDDSNMG